MSIRRRLRQVAVQAVAAVVDRGLGLARRMGVGPERLVRSTVDGHGPDVTWQQLHPSLPLATVEPTLANDEHPAAAQYRRDHGTWGARRTAPAGILTLRDADVSMPTGMHRWRGRPFRDGLISTDALRNPKYLAALATMRRGAETVDEGVLLALPWNHNFFHWLVELLPRLEMVERVPELRDTALLVPTSAPEFVRESLRITGFGTRARQLDDGVYRVGTLHIPSPLSTTGDVSPIAMQWLDERFPAAEARGRRIYISRGDAPVRYIAREAQVSALLEDEFGFETVVMSQLPLEEQVRTFRQAEVIVGSHGAAFAHLAFAPRGASVLELFQEGHFNQCYGRMAAVRGLRYGFMVCDRQGLGLRVDEPALRRLVGALVTEAQSLGANR